MMMNRTQNRASVKVSLETKAVIRDLADETGMAERDVADWMLTWANERLSDAAYRDRIHELELQVDELRLEANDG
jgi:hypothetical protein